MLLRACATPIAHGVGSYNLLPAVQDLNGPDQVAVRPRPKPGKG